ncbi:MAG TPA: MFS transporter [Parvularcula sp.]|nr:MFS transporter [Parvularcula sp.]
MKSSIFLWALTAALAGFLFGFDTAVISGAEQDVQRAWSMNDALHGLAISSALWGTVLGAIFGGVPSDRFGRKPTLIGIGVLYFVSAIGSALAFDPMSFIFFRFIGGIGVGASSVAAPAYIAEISPPAWRGRLVALFQTMIVVGILVAFLSNLLIEGAGANDWRWMLGAEGAPALLYLLAVLAIPESPRWLAQRKGDLAAARTILEKGDPAGAEAALAELSARAEPAMSLARFFSSGLSKPILLAFLIAVFNQLSGINAIIYYAPRIFALTGAEESATLLATVGVGAVNLVFTLAGLALIDRAGRKTLLLWGAVGYIVSLAGAAFGFASDSYAIVLGCVFLFIASHAIGQGAVIWVYISEIFPTAARAMGQSLGASTHWALAAALTFVMPGVLANVAAWKIFAAFAAFMAIELVWVLTMVRETRGHSLEELARKFSARSGIRP